MENDDFLESVGLTGNIGESEPFTPPEEKPRESADKGDLPDADPEKKTDPAPDNRSDVKSDPPKQTPDKDADAKIRELETERARLEAEKATLDKRFRDTQAAYTRERQARVALEKRGGKGDHDEEEEDWFEEEDSPEDEAGPLKKDDPEKPLQTKESPELKKELDQQRAQLDDLRKAEAVRSWNAAEEAFRAGNSDYDSVVNDEFTAAINAGDERSNYLLHEFKRRGASPQAAYEVGQLYRRLEGKAEIAAAPAQKEKTKTPASRQDDPAWNSMPPESGGGKPTSTGSLIDEMFAGK